MGQCKLIAFFILLVRGGGGGGSKRRDTQYNYVVFVLGKAVINPLEYSNRIILVLFDFC